MTSVSHSEVDSYLLCRRKHYYGYTRGLERATSATSLARGTMGHALLERFYSTVLKLGGNSVPGQLKAFQAGVDAAFDLYESKKRWNTWDDDKHMAVASMIFDWYLPHEPLVRLGWQILAVEQSFNLEYMEGLTMPFVVDLIAYDKQGKVVVIDHKFVYDFYSYKMAEVQPQIPKYIAGLRALNYPAAYGAYNMIRTRPLKKAGNTESDRVGWLPIQPTSKRVTTTFSEQVGVAAEIQSIKQLTPDEQDQRAYRTANKMVCQSCSFQDLCTAELSGQSTKLLLQTEYRKRERKTWTEISEDAD